MDSNSVSHSSVLTLGISGGVREETRDKFEALLKAATNKRSKKNAKSKSKEKLLGDQYSSTTCSENLLAKESDVHNFELNTDPSKNYIFDKFFGQTNEEIISVEVQNEHVTKIKPPIPKPRKSKCNVVSEKDQSPTTSQGTFNVTSPKIVKNVCNDSPQSNKTYNLEEVGDVLVHEGSLQPKIRVQSAASSKYLEKAEVETLNDDSKSEKDTTFSKSKSLNKEDKTQVVRNELSTDLIEYEHETTPKQRRKKKESNEGDEESKLTKNNYDYEKIAEIIIHKTDRLQLDSLVVHPLVKIHVVDITTGKYFPKSDKNRPVVFFYENKDCTYISPIMTHTYNLQEKRILFPSWEETILLNEDYEYFKNESQRIILFFEVLDFVSFSAIHQLNKKDCSKGWHNIAFAFLKLAGKNNVLNAGKKMRLQLYNAHQLKKEDPHVCSVWAWWKKQKFEKYPSTLYVTFKATASPTKIVETFRSKTPVQRETSTKIKLFADDTKNEVSHVDSTFSNGRKDSITTKSSTPTWSRSLHEICKLPNKCLTKFENYEDGCFIMKFSPSGLLLACAVRNEDYFNVVVFSVLSLKQIHKFPSNQGLIYDLKWSSDDALLITASADNTISIFNTVTSSFLQILPHPSFVYCCDISQEKVVVSGCYDGTLRIWSQTRQGKKSEFNLFQELEGHKGYITSVCFYKKSNIISADSTGLIIEWKKETNDWVLKREILLLDLKEVTINEIMLFPREKRLLVHSRDSILRIVDLKSGCVLQWLRGGLNRRVQTFCTISPCGTYVYCGSENGNVHVWNSKNGHEIASFVPYSSGHQFLVIHCVECHPFDNIVAVSHYGKNLPILIFTHDKSVEQPEIDITLKEKEEYYQMNKYEILKEPRLKGIVSKKHYPASDNSAKYDFKGILEKMDKMIQN